LRQRLQEGKIYPVEKVPAALANFFTEENLTTLRELALREVASSVDRTREQIVRRAAGEPEKPRNVDRVMVAMASDTPHTAVLLRKASRIAGRLNSDWYCVYVQTPEESADRIDATVQRKLVGNIQRAQAMGAEVVKLTAADVADALTTFANDHGVALILVGRSRRSWFHRIFRGSVVSKLVNNPHGVDVLIVAETLGVIAVAGEP
jgi:two-component system sensor histidine kinase KdpD